MTTQILYVKSSVFGDQGVSSQLSEQLLARFREQEPNVQVVERNLVDHPLPHISADYLTALGVEPTQRSERQKQLVALGDRVISEVRDADIVIVTAPMYNFNIPSTLKAWADYLARAGETFRYTEQGPEGLLQGKKAYVITTRGGVHRGQASDIETPYLSTYLNFVGIDDIEFVYAEGLNMAAREQGIGSAHQHIGQLQLSAPSATV